MSLATAWSFSALLDYEGCPYRIQLKADKAERYQDEVPIRGTVIHDAAEAYVKGERPDLIPELRKFKDEFAAERELFAEGGMQVEEDWGFTRQWTEAPWRSATLRMKLDQFKWRPGDDMATVIDLKSGKRWGNEVKHTQQGQLYAVGAFMRYPELQSIDARFRYVDEGKETSKVYFRDEKFDRMFDRWNARADKMLSDTSPRPKPSKHNCRFCPYSPNPGKGSGACPYGVPHDD
jgi:CRISPR/Cas system-associated exonuclease Cas4 (RecB family)